MRLEIKTHIAAPLSRCFDLARSIDVHLLSAEKNNERALAGVTSGLIGMGEQVTWSARHFGFRFRLTSQITAFDRPTYFRDEMTKGPFESMAHDHLFVQHGLETCMTDQFFFESPFGFLGKWANRLVIGRHMEQFLRQRASVIKRVAETEAWKGFLVDEKDPKHFDFVCKKSE